MNKNSIWFTSGGDWGKEPNTDLPLDIWNERVKHGDLVFLSGRMFHEPNTFTRFLTNANGVKRVVWGPQWVPYKSLLEASGTDIVEPVIRIKEYSIIVSDFPLHRHDKNFNFYSVPPVEGDPKNSFSTDWNVWGGPFEWDLIIEFLNKKS